MKKGQCKYFNGIGNGFRDEGVLKKCKAGVCYRSHVGGDDFGWAIRIPCFDDKRSGAIVPCDLFQEVTAADLAEWHEKVQKSLANLGMSVDLISRIKGEHRGKSWSGIEKCPVCSGKIRVSHSAYNGHTRAHCETPDCLRWIE